MPYYAVNKGHTPGIYDTWAECQGQVLGFTNANFKKFKLLSDATVFYKNGTLPSPTLAPTPSPILSNQSTRTITTSPDNVITIYTDGSFVKKQGKCGSGYGIYIPKYNINLSNILAAPKTNNRAELTAIIEAIKLLDTTVPLHIYTDSKYSILIATGTGLKYQKKGFITRNKNNKLVNVLNRDLIEQLLPLLQEYTVSFKHILAHTGLNDEHSKGNHIADKLALDAANRDLIENND